MYAYNRAMVYVPFDWSFVRSLCGAAMYSTRRVLSVDVHMWCSEKSESEREREREREVRTWSGREEVRACLLTRIGIQNLDERRR
jgi:hypothetical protein